MCGMCGLLQGSGHWSQAPAGSAGRRQRLIQIARANRLLALWRLRLSDFHGQSYVLAGPTGASVLIADFGALWPAAEQMLDRKSTRLNSSHSQNSYAVFCLEK